MSNSLHGLRAPARPPTNCPPWKTLCRPAHADPSTTCSVSKSPPGSRPPARPPARPETTPHTRLSVKAKLDLQCLRGSKSAKSRPRSANQGPKVSPTAYENRAKASRATDGCDNARPSQAVTMCLPCGPPTHRHNHGHDSEHGHGAISSLMATHANGAKHGECVRLVCKHVWTSVFFRLDWRLSVSFLLQFFVSIFCQ